MMIPSAAVLQVAWLLSSADAFSVRQVAPCHSTITTQTRTALPTTLFLSGATEDDAAAPSSPKRRRKRVVRKTESVSIGEEEEEESVFVACKEEEIATAPPAAPLELELKPREDAPVELVVRDVRDVVSGVSSSATNAQLAAGSKAALVSDTGKDENANSLEQLLADAREMRLERSSTGGAAEGNDDATDGLSIPGSILNVISTIVTVDFFVVCALLVWFLAGIFSSYVLKNDDVQIAFNGIFEPVVQPALGILMIGSIAGAVFKKDEDE